MKVCDYLKERPLLFDGSMGTYILERSQEFSENLCEKLNVTHSDFITSIHREYIQAGAVALKTNSFGIAGQIKNMAWEECETLLKASWDVVQKAVSLEGKECFVFADIGPAMADSDKEAFAAYKKIVDVFLACGATNFLFETQDGLEGIEKVAEYIKSCEPESFILFSFATSPEGYTRSGYLTKKLFWSAQEMSAIDGVGYNCISGPKHLLEMIKQMPMERVKKYITVMPNAGYPTMNGNRIFYGKTKNYFADTVIEMVNAGVSIVGGCCGITPKEIAALKALLPEKYENAYPPGHPKKQAEEIEDNSKAEKCSSKASSFDNTQNTLAQKLKLGKKVLVVELDPPVETDIQFFMEGAARYKYAGVDAIDIADCPVAKARIDSSLLACKLKRELGIDTVPHMTCRDRNINATKALLLGLNVEGVNNVLTVTGDPVPVAERGLIKTVFNYNSAVLARHIQSFNKEIFYENPFMVSGALNINALHFESQIHHAKKKIANGVSVLFTQPVLSERGLENLKYARKVLDVKILGGVMPVVSYRNACFMNNEMAGISVDERLMECYKDKSREEGEELAYQISCKVIDEIADYVDGFYVITPFKRVDLILRIIHYINKVHR